MAPVPAGSATAEFDRLLDSSARSISVAIRQVCGGRYRSLVPDVEQEVRLIAWRRLAAGGPIRNARSYFYKVALTTALAMVARAAPQQETEGRAPGGAPATGSALFPVEQGVLVKQALHRLRPDESRAVRAYLSGLNHSEVALRFGWTAAVARHRIYRGLRTLRGGLAG